MKSYFSSKFFSANRRRLRALIDITMPIVITANGLLQRGGDSSYAFSQDANFWYLTGIDEPDILLIMDGTSEYLIVPPRDISRTAFDGAVDDTALTNRSGITEILETDAGWKRLLSSLKRKTQLATVAAAPPYIERYGLYANPARAHLASQLHKRKPSIELIDVAPQLIHLRMIKQAPELRALQQAIDITLTTIKSAASSSRLPKYLHEYQLEAEISRGFRRRGASGHAFDPIVAGGERACTLHNIANNSRFTANDLVVIDVGAEVEHYAADITRTLPHGKISRRQRAVHDAVADVQEFAFSLLQPGVVIGDYEQQIELFMGEKLRTLGLIQTIDHDSVRAYYPHATSHFLGLNVHDAGDYAQPLEPGMVITVEPGIYIPQESIGVRIEDDVLITKTGITILSKKLSGRLPSAA